MNMRETLRINERGHLQIGEIDTVELVKRFPTPVYVLDEDFIRKVCRTFVNTLKEIYGDADVAYASKALSVLALYRIVASEGLRVDVVSGGELYAALKAGISPDRIAMHGNNKLPSEINYAIKSGVDMLVIDGADEAELIDAVAARHGKVQKVMVRVNPGVDAHTHRKVQTAAPDSKFGFAIINGDADRAVETTLACKNLAFKGIHCHIGSQIFEKETFTSAAKIMADYIAHIKDTKGIEIEELNLGGGYAVYYAEGDPKFGLKGYRDYVAQIAHTLDMRFKEKNIRKPHLVIEPGRSVVAEAGITLYTVGAVKNIEGVRKYYAVDGGMYDNPRYALYGSRYSAIIANKANLPATEKVSIAGKCCETGDLLAENIMLQPAKRGDILAMLSTGAYNYSMSSNYNNNLRPAMVLVNSKNAEYIVAPESYEDIVSRQNIPDYLK